VSKYCLASLALVVSAIATRPISAQRPTDSVVVSQAGAVARSPDRARIRGAVAYTIDSTEIRASSAHTLSEVIQARVPSLSVLQSGGVAAQGAQIRSRGTRSFFGSSDPIVVVDGVRVDATQDATVVAIDVSSSRVDDIALDDIARIDVLPGPAAAGLYGAGASGGAIIITTKSGDAPGLHLSSRLQSGIGMIATNFPANYQLEGTNSAGRTVVCPLDVAATGQCTPTKIDSWNPLEKASPFRTAQNASGALAVDGGVRQTSGRFGVSGNRMLGVTSDDDVGQLSARGNVTQHIGRSFEIAGNGAYLSTSAGLPPRGRVFDKSNVIANGLFGSAVQDSLDGYQWAPPGTSTREHAHHWTGSATANWNVFQLLYLSGLYGRDNISELDYRAGDRGVGNGMSVEQGGFDHSLTTINVSARTADWDLFHTGLRTRSLLAYDQLRSLMTGRDSLGLASYPEVFSSAGFSTRARIAGKSLRQELAWNERFLVGAGARWERWSPGLPRHFFKNGDLSVFVGRVLRVDSLCLRSAYGEASNWSPGQPQWSGTFGSSLSPMFLPLAERVKEGEIGVDFAFADRAQLSLTAYRADASRLFAGLSGGGGFGPPPSPTLGSLRNEGLELASVLRILRTSWLGWDATLRASTLRERTLSVGPQGGDLFVPPGGTSIPGSAVDGYYTRPYTYVDANHDGLIGANEIQTLNASPIGLGSSLPSREASMLSMWTFRRGVSLSALLDYRGGQKLANMNEAFRCLVYGNCRAVNDPSTSLADQAQAAAGFLTQLPYVEGASFAKLREVSLRWAVPARVAGLIGGPSSITIAGRNLATWTRYRGIDPELNVQPLSVLPRIDWAETPIPREFFVRLDFGGSVGRR
jgi:TonB-dependent starch-binding outer membrane protein SusC